MEKTVLQLETLTCPSCVRRIEGSLSKAKGVESAVVKFNASKVEVEHDVTLSKEAIQTIVSNLGYKVLSTK